MRTVTQPEPMSRAELLLACVALPLVVVGLIELATPVTEFRGGWDSDGLIYGRILDCFREGGDLSEVVAPWKWRILTALLASLLPFEPLASFRVLGFASNCVSLALVHALARLSGFARRDGVIAVLLYAGVFWTVKFTAYSPAYVDFQTQLLLLLGLYLALTGRDAALPPLVAIAVLQKESLLILSPIAWFCCARRHGFSSRRSLLQLVLVVALPLAVMAGIRAVILGYVASPPEKFLRHATALSDADEWLRLSLSFFSGLGILPLVLLLHRRAAWRHARSHPHWLLLVALGAILLLGGIDKARLFLYMLPAVVMFAVAAMQPVLAAGGAPARLWLLATLVLHAYLGHQLTPMGTFHEYLDRMVPVYAKGSLTPQVVRVCAASALWLAIDLGVRRIVRRDAGGAQAPPGPG
jgi:hypothetical protein